MPTLVRLVTVLGILFAMGYGTLYAMANYLSPQPRPIVQAIALPANTELHTGRSAAELLNSQASALSRHHSKVVR